MASLMVRFNRFAWRFAGSRSWALRDVSLEIREGELVVIAGPSGSGKSTLAMAMCGLLVGRQDGQAEGSVHVAGQDVATTPLYHIAQRIGLVQQNPDTHFATLTVGDELAFGMENRCLPPDVIRRRSAEASELLSITDLHDRTLSSLSGGEKQRVAIASIIAGAPQALVLDEPSAGLDPAVARDLFRSLAELSRRSGLTVVIVEHNLAALLPYRPRLVSLEDGRIDMDARADDGESVDPAGLMHFPPGYGPQPTPIGAPIGNEVIADVSEVTVEFEGRTALDDVSLQIHAGEVVGIMGPSGGGKTTLLLSLLGLVSPVRGTVRMCGIQVSRQEMFRLARCAGLVFQNADHQLVADTVWREAIFAARNLQLFDSDVEREALQLLQKAGLLARKDVHPFRLSWGQKRRLNLISAILHRPRLILLDEPFAGQDWDNVIFQLDALRSVLTGPSRATDKGAGGLEPSPHGACLMVTHDPRVVLHSCTRLLFLADGRVVLDAPVPQAFQRLAERGYDAYVPSECRLALPAHAGQERRLRAGRKLAL